MFLNSGSEVRSPLGIANLFAYNLRERQTAIAVSSPDKLPSVIDT